MRRQVMGFEATATGRKISSKETNVPTSNHQSLKCVSERKETSIAEMKNEKSKDAGDVYGFFLLLLFGVTSKVSPVDEVG